MNDEIKKILEKMFLNCDTQEEKNKVLDYITNLQQENQKLNKENEKWWAIIKDYEKDVYDMSLENSKLEQENERLKEQNNDLRKTYRNTYNKLFENGNDELARYFQAQIDDHKEWLDYKAKVEKALELTNNLLKTETIGYYQIIFQKQLDVLNGRSNE